MGRIDPELLVDREEVWNILGDNGPSFGTGAREPPGDWWCLRASPDLVEYRGLLMRDLQCDKSSAGYFVELVHCGKAEGYLEALRVLHHMLKDKDYPATVHDPEVPESVANSKWLRGACLEALDALQNPEDWEQGPEFHKGKGKGKSKRSSKSTYDDDSPWAGYSSSSSRASRTSRSSTRKTGWR